MTNPRKDACPAQGRAQKHMKHMRNHAAVRRVRRMSGMGPSGAWLHKQAVMGAPGSAPARCMGASSCCAAPGAAVRPGMVRLTCAAVPQASSAAVSYALLRHTPRKFK